ncbi:dihydrodipicolinate reductase [Nocardia sp. NPDC050378]|uniref:dihydrodipicolinate reductase n=1 Tax=Nocardia sp. NPDC050378 TaxID=3155400 RepID=UPI0033E5BC30
MWASGQSADHLAAAVGEHPVLDLLAICSDAHPGADIPAQTDLARTVQSVVTLAPDCVLYLPRHYDTDTVCRLLMAGINVITTRSELHHPDSMEPTVLARLESACWAGRASLYSTGVSPAFVTELMPITIGAIQSRIENVSIEEYTDLTGHEPTSPPPGLARFGTPCPTHMDHRALIHFQQNFGPSLRLIADGLGLAVDTVEVSGDYAATRGGTAHIPAATVGALRMSLVGSHLGITRVTYRATWYCTRNLEPAWRLEPNGWRATITGDPTPMEITVRSAFPLGAPYEPVPTHTAHRAARTIPFLCMAPPGIRTSLELPPSTVSTR